MDGRDRPGPFGPLSVFVDRHAVAVYYLALLAVSWTYLFLTHDMGDSPARMVPLVLVGPSVFAFIVVFLARGAAGAGELGARLLRWRAPVRLYLMVLLGVPGCFFAAAYAVTAVLFPERLAAPPVGALVSTGINFVLLLVLVGLGEEFGWRGLALPRLQRRTGPLRASLVVGLMWFAWHLPVGLGSPTWLEEEAAFLVSVVAATFCYTWLFNRTGGGLLLVVLLHATENAWATTYQATFALDRADLVFFEWVRAAVWVLLAGVVLVRTRRPSSVRPPER